MTVKMSSSARNQKLGFIIAHAETLLMGIHLTAHPKHRDIQAMIVKHTTPSPHSTLYATHLAPLQQPLVAAHNSYMFQPDEMPVSPVSALLAALFTATAFFCTGYIAHTPTCSLAGSFTPSCILRQTPAMPKDVTCPKYSKVTM